MGAYCKTVNLSNPFIGEAILSKIEDVEFDMASFYTDVDTELTVSALRKTLNYDVERGVITCDVVVRVGNKKNGAVETLHQTYPYKLFQDVA